METPRTNLRSSRRFAWIILVGAILAAGAYIALRFGKGANAPSSTAVAAASAPDAAATERAPSAPNPAEPPVDAAGARGLLESVSANALWRKWLAEGDLVHRWAVMTDNVAEGASPRKVLGFLEPRAPFSVARRGDRFVIASESYARYDAVGDAIDSIDARALATAYRRLHTVLEAAYRALGFPAGSLDHVTSRALHRIEAAPVAEGDVYVESQEGRYVFADPHLEQLRAVEKHLLRMGPRNERIVKAKAREVMEALALPAIASGPRP